MSAGESSYPLPCPHDPPERIADEVFMVRGSIKMNPLLRVSRNMAVIRDEGELTLVNPIRLSPSGEEELTSLGEIRQILRLGAFHGMDDPYYVDRFKAKLWCQPGGRAYKQPLIDVEVGDGCSLPFPDAELLPFEGARQPEAVLLLRRGGGMLLTCDAIQHYGDYRHNNLPARMLMPFIGFPKTTLIGPIWLKYMTPRGSSLRADFERLLSLDFDSLLSAHGSFLPRGAKEAVRVAIERTFD